MTNETNNSQNFVQNYTNSSSNEKRARKAANGESEFDLRTDETSAELYFQFYGYLNQQQNMMQDFVRTSTYQRAIHENFIDFKDKIVVDVGTGSGILSFFAVQAGARHVYAIEASKTMAEHCRTLIDANNCANRITLISGKVEEIDLSEQVDVIISEPMGYMLVNERMLESYVNARRFFKPGGGKMFPSTADLHLALFTDELLYMECSQRTAFWSCDNFFGINLTSMLSNAKEELFRQPIVDSFSPTILMSKSIKWTFDFINDDVERLHVIDIPLNYLVNRSGLVHGVATWFDVCFDGTEKKIWLSTAPSETITHWYQVRLLLRKPIMVYKQQMLNGHLRMIANERQTYDVTLTFESKEGMVSNTYDLKLPYFRNAQSTSSSYSSESPSDALLQKPNDFIFLSNNVLLPPQPPPQDKGEDF